jgi:ubiquinone/menaquinone biosynthesis C-methylase UbiE
MVESWLADQANATVQTWEKSMERHYPQFLKTWNDPVEHLRSLREDKNSLAAAQALDWNTYLIGDHLTLLDLGAGTGWLSILLSTRPNVERIFALDSSPNNLGQMLPALCQLMGGRLDKITPVLGLFTPLLVADGFFDVVVASAALHHADDLSACLQDVWRVLKPGGHLLILNEVPITRLEYTVAAVNRCRKTVWSLVRKRWQPLSKPVTATNMMTDPLLGDRAYCVWQWQQALAGAGFSTQTLVTPYSSYTDPRVRQPLRLTHFVAQKAQA